MKNVHFTEITFGRGERKNKFCGGDENVILYTFTVVCIIFVAVNVHPIHPITFLNFFFKSPFFNDGYFMKIKGTSFHDAWIKFVKLNFLGSCKNEKSVSSKSSSSSVFALRILHNSKQRENSKFQIFHSRAHQRSKG